MIPAGLPEDNNRMDMADDSRWAKSVYGNIVYYGHMIKRLQHTQHHMMVAANVLRWVSGFEA